MSNIERSLCDYCGKEVDDPYLHYGWIELSIKTFSAHRGRKKDGCARSGPYLSDKELDFCCIKCFADYFRELCKKVK